MVAKRASQAVGLASATKNAASIAPLAGFDPGLIAGSGVEADDAISLFLPK